MIPLTPQAERLIDMARRGDGAAVLELLAVLVVDARTNLADLILTAENVPYASRLQGQIEAWESLNAWLTQRQPAINPPRQPIPPRRA